MSDRSQRLAPCTGQLLSHRTGSKRRVGSGDVRLERKVAIKDVVATFASKQVAAAAAEDELTTGEAKLGFACKGIGLKVPPNVEGNEAGANRYDVSVDVHLIIQARNQVKVDQFVSVLSTRRIRGAAENIGVRRTTHSLDPIVPVRDSGVGRRRSGT